MCWPTCFSPGDSSVLYANSSFLHRDIMATRTGFCHMLWCNRFETIQVTQETMYLYREYSLECSCTRFYYHVCCYRILMQFRTRKAHCWTIRDKDLLRYLSFAVIVVTVYLASWTAVSLNFRSEGWNLLLLIETEEGDTHVACKPQWWNYVTEFGNLSIFACFIFSS